MLPRHKGNTNKMKITKLETPTKDTFCPFIIVVSLLNFQKLKRNNILMHIKIVCKEYNAVF